MATGQTPIEGALESTMMGAESCASYLAQAEGRHVVPGAPSIGYGMSRTHRVISEAKRIDAQISAADD